MVYNPTTALILDPSVQKYLYCLKVVARPTVTHRRDKRGETRNIASRLKGKRCKEEARN